MITSPVLQAVEPKLFNLRLPLDERRELDELALEVRRRAGKRGTRRVMVTRVIGKLLGRNGLCLDRRIGIPGYFFRDTNQIVVNPDMPDLRDTLAHELGHWAFANIQKRTRKPVDEEAAANYFGRAFLAPASELRRAHARAGENLRAIASHFAMSQGWLVLRLGDVLGDERAVVFRYDYDEQTHICTQSSGAFPWADTPVLDVCAGRRRIPGLAKSRIRPNRHEGPYALFALRATSHRAR